jgi:hypothetical protein
VIPFKKTLEYRNAINLCYGRQEVQELQGCVLDAHTWAICEVVVETLFPIVKQCILNQIQGHCLLSNALNATFSIIVCMQNHSQQFDITPFNFVKGDIEFELGALRVRMVVEVQVILTPILAFTSSYNASKVHNMLALMLDSRFKSLDVVKTFVG